MQTGLACVAGRKGMLIVLNGNQDKQAILMCAVVGSVCELAQNVYDNEPQAAANGRTSV